MGQIKYHNGVAWVPAVAGNQGATGPAGANGANGATGAAGVDGATGATGVAGSNGNDGATGATGVAGTNGATGATGVQGATGPAGPNVYTDTLQTVTDRGFTTTNRINITNTTDATSTSSAALTVAGGVGIGGDIFIQGNPNGTSVAVFGVPTGFAVLPSTVVQATANVNAYVQNNFQNLTNGTQASADIVITAATGTDLNNYLDLGMTSGAWNGTQANSLGTALGGNDGYLYVQGGTGGGNLVIGTTSAGKYLKIVAEGTGTNSVVATFRAPNTVSTNTLTGSLTIAGGVGIGGNLYVSNLAIFEQVVEAFNAYSTTINAAAVVALDCNNGNIFNITSTVNGNWTANFTNLSLNSGYGTNVILVINQGATPYIPTALQIGGASQTINWQGGSAPTGSANKKDVISYSILSTAASTYMVLAQLVSFG